MAIAILPQAFATHVRNFPAARNHGLTSGYIPNAMALVAQVPRERSGWALQYAYRAQISGCYRRAVNGRLCRGSYRAAGGIWITAMLLR